MLCWNVQFRRNITNFLLLLLHFTNTKENRWQTLSGSLHVWTAGTIILLHSGASVVRTQPCPAPAISQEAGGARNLPSLLFCFINTGSTHEEALTGFTLDHLGRGLNACMTFHLRSYGAHSLSLHIDNSF